MRSQYVPDLARFAAVCESNYRRLSHLERLAVSRDSDVVLNCTMASATWARSSSRVLKAPAIPRPGFSSNWATRAVS